jgi:hypothetical protein
MVVLLSLRSSGVERIAQGITEQVEALRGHQDHRQLPPIPNQ